MENGGGASSRDKPVARTHVEIDLHESLSDAMAAFSNLAYLASKQAEDAEQVRLYMAMAVTYIADLNRRVLRRT